MVFQAISGDKDFLMKINSNEIFGIIHSVYKRAINIEDNNGNLYSIVTANIDNAPNTIRINISDFYFFNNFVIKPGSIVININGNLFFSSIKICLSTVEVWQAILPLFPALNKIKELTFRLEILKKYILLYGKSGGLKEYIFQKKSDEIKDIFGQVLKERSKGLILELKRKNFSVAYSIGRSLIGLGGGQTPSGDDFCAGLISVFNMPHGPFDESFRQFGHYLAFEAKKLTTKISQALLINASSGKIREYLCCLLIELVKGTAEGTAKASKNVLNIGSMSGTDLAVGIIAGLELGIEFRNGGK